MNGSIRGDDSNDIVSLPSNWKSVDFWTIATQISRPNPQDAPLLSVYLDRGVIPYSEGGGLVHKPSESLDKYQLVVPEDFVLNNQQAWRGSVGISHSRGLVSPAYLVFKLSEALNTHYANYQFRDRLFVDKLMLASQGVGDIQRQIKRPLLRKAKVLLPPLEEQHAIATYLDVEAGRIDSLIAKKSRFIELLREKRQALITHTIKAAGGTPVRLKHLLVQPLQYGANEAADGDDPELPRFIRITDIDDSGSLRNDTFKSLPWDVAAPYLLRSGDVLVARSGATVGKSFMYKERYGPACFAGYLIRAQFNEQRILPEFAYLSLLTHEYWNYIQHSAIQATIQNVSAERYGNYPLQVPPLSIQATVVRTLSEDLAMLDRLINRVLRSVELLQERRTALITAAVTGQIDVQAKLAKQEAPA